MTYKWFESYLNGRQMRVKCNVASSGKTEYSDYMKVSYGTPQGSCLGPLIFLIFTNDLHRHLVYSSSILFADDTTLYKTHRNLVYLKWCLEDDLCTLNDWFAANKLTLNLDKTVCMLFHKNNNQWNWPKGKWYDNNKPNRDKILRFVAGPISKLAQPYTETNTEN